MLLHYFNSLVRQHRRAGPGEPVFTRVLDNAIDADCSGSKRELDKGDESVANAVSVRWEILLRES